MKNDVKKNIKSMHALHAVCDHGGLWDERIGVYGVDMENGTQTTGLCLITEIEPKGETK